MKLILAADENWAIGNGGDLLCHIPGDLKFFKEKTLDMTVVMGRATLESLPGSKPLPKRNNIVLTSQPDYEVAGATISHSTEELMEILKEYDSDEVFIIGGEKVYKDFLKYCDTCYITKIQHSFQADRHFVNLDEMTEFQIAWESEVHEENGYKYKFVEYKRKK